MKSCTPIVTILAAALQAAGCVPDYRPAPMPKPAAPVTRTAKAPPGPQPAPQSPAGTVPPSPAKSPAGSSAAVSLPPPSGFASLPPPKAGTMPIQLSTGIGLAQTGPEGTIMSFSVLYQFVQGEPPSSVGYFLVIGRAQGAPAKVPARLSREGNLMALMPWRPEEGPFQAHVEDQSGTRLSDSIDLRPP
jgi:hypothetical protein